MLKIKMKDNGSSHGLQNSSDHFVLQFVGQDESLMFLRQNISWSRRSVTHRFPPVLSWGKSLEFLFCQPVSWPLTPVARIQGAVLQTDGRVPCHPDPSAGSGVSVKPVPGSEWTFHWGTGSAERNQNHFLLASLHQLIMENQNLDCLFPGERSVTSRQNFYPECTGTELSLSEILFTSPCRNKCCVQGPVGMWAAIRMWRSGFFLWIPFRSARPNRMDSGLRFRSAAGAFLSD